jgi:S-DNA-T family DNA segregation ATPase FtsK/SpoIIIE
MLEQILSLNNILKSLKIKASCVKYSKYKNACFYDLELRPGARVKDIEKYAVELGLLLKKGGKLRIVVDSSNGVIKLEFIEKCQDKTHLFELGNQFKRPQGGLMCLLGETFDGQPIWMDLLKTPHLLIGGTSGSGKSVLLHNIIANVLMYPYVKLYLMDPKNIEFYKYSRMNKIKLSNEFDDCLKNIQELCSEMDRRYLAIKENNSIKFPIIVLVIDEYSDLIMQDVDGEFYKSLTRLSQKSRAAGIHIVLSTQRPSVDVVNGTIKANFPARISCRVTSHVDSKIILDTVGAENLMGNGDALINTEILNMKRFQVAYVTPDKICKYLNG